MQCFQKRNHLLDIFVYPISKIANVPFDRLMRRHFDKSRSDSTQSKNKYYIIISKAPNIIFVIFFVIRRLRKILHGFKSICRKNAENTNPTPTQVLFDIFNNFANEKVSSFGSYESKNPNIHFGSVLFRKIWNADFAPNITKLPNE